MTLVKSGERVHQSFCSLVANLAQARCLHHDNVLVWHTPEHAHARCLYYYIFCMHSLLLLFCSSTQTCSIDCYCYELVACMQCVQHPHNHPRGISTLVLLIGKELYMYIPSVVAMIFLTSGLDLFSQYHFHIR